MTVATTILEQLGGRRFAVMTGSRDFVGSDNALMFKVGAGAKNGINKVRVTLTAADDYTVEAFTIRGVKVTERARVEGVYAENLQGVFTSITGFYTRL